jgi:hypothetical protein
MKMMVCAKSGDAAGYRCPGHAVEKEKIQDRGVGRAAMVLLVFGHIDADFLTRSGCKHVRLLKSEILFE